MSVSRIAVITGSNKGIGYEIAKKFGTDENTLCILTARNEEYGLRACEQLLQEGANVVYKNLNIDDEASVETFTAQMTEEYGKIDVLVNNAAIAFKAADPTPFQQQAEPTVRVNFWGTVRVCDALMPLIRRSSAGRVVNVSSTSGRLDIFRRDSALRAQFESEALTRDQLYSLMDHFVASVQGGTHQRDGWPSTCYGMSKLGLTAFTKILAREEAEANSGVLVNACHPGYCVTDMTSRKGSRTAEHGARTPFFLGTLPDGSSSTGGFWYDCEEIEW